jgi:hypothetical protein
VTRARAGRREARPPCRLLQHSMAVKERHQRLERLIQVNRTAGERAGMDRGRVAFAAHGIGGGGPDPRLAQLGCTTFGSSRKLLVVDFSSSIFEA